MMRLIRKLFQRLPTRRISEAEQRLIARRLELERELRERQRQIDAEYAALKRENRQNEAIYLIEQEVVAATATRYRHSEGSS